MCGRASRQFHLQCSRLILETAHRTNGAHVWCVTCVCGVQSAACHHQGGTGRGTDVWETGSMRERERRVRKGTKHIKKVCSVRRERGACVVVSHLCRAPPNAEKFIVCIVSVVYLRAWSHREMLNVSGGGGANTQQCVLSVWPPHTDTTFCWHSSPPKPHLPHRTSPQNLLRARGLQVSANGDTV